MQLHYLYLNGSKLVNEDITDFIMNIKLQKNNVNTEIKNHILKGGITSFNYKFDIGEFCYEIIIRKDAAQDRFCVNLYEIINSNTKFCDYSEFKDLYEKIKSLD